MCVCLLSQEEVSWIWSNMENHQFKNKNPYITFSFGSYSSQFSTCLLLWGSMAPALKMLSCSVGLDYPACMARGGASATAWDLETWLGGLRTYHDVQPPPLGPSSGYTVLPMLTSQRLLPMEWALRLHCLSRYSTDVWIRSSFMMMIFSIL